MVKINNVQKGRPIFFVHSIEGISTTVQELALQLETPAFCFQQTPQVPMQNMKSMAQFYIQVCQV